MSQTYKINYWRVCSDDTFVKPVELFYNKNEYKYK